MKRISLCLIVLLSILPSQLSAKVKISDQERQELTQMIETALAGARSQSLLMAHNLEVLDGKLPRTIDAQGRLVTADCYWWCSGFFPGLLWMLSEDCPQEPQLRQYAELFTRRVEPVRKVTDNHDIGFMLGCSYGHAYRITGDEYYMTILSEGAHNLSTRFMPAAGVTKSWGTSSRWTNPVIIDNMMNLEILELVGKKEGNQEYLKIADSHAQTTMKNHYRPDFSTWHVVDYDSETGKVVKKVTAQGFSDESAWARGQAWGLYGYTMMYDQTGNKKYLKQARNVANYLTTRSNIPEDAIPYWDYDCTDIPNTPRDASSAAITASAYLLLSQLDKKSSTAQRWWDMALRQLRSLASPAYTAYPGSARGFILLHSTGSLPAKSEVDVPLTYADYYYVEALLRLKKMIAE